MSPDLNLIEHVCDSLGHSNAARKPSPATTDDARVGAVATRVDKDAGMELTWRKIFSGPCIRDSAHKTFGPTDLTSTYSVCTRRVFGGTGGMEPRPSGPESGALTTRLPTALFNLFSILMSGVIIFFCARDTAPEVHGQIEMAQNEPQIKQLSTREEYSFE
ncbi:hypothetical protein TNCV_2855851 [Trichonephila clavipes]|nr:hypothetical protein TNCV_2855851 [Trichonephila clavipes]